MDNNELRMKYVFNTYGDLIYRNPNVRGFGISNKVINGQETNIPCLTIYVNKKISEKSIYPQHRIPKYMKGVLTDVVEQNGLRFFSNEKRPAHSGDSVASERYDKEGTITYAVTDIETRKKHLLLGCNHVIGYLSERVIQPGIPSGGVPPKRDDNGKNSSIGKVIEDSRLKFTSRNKLKIENFNYMDAALAIIDEPNPKAKLEQGIITSKGEKIYVKESVSIDKLRVGMSVWIKGVGSGEVEGEIKSLLYNGYINYIPNQILGYREHILVNIQCKPGDSGALGIIKDGTNRAFGMLVAGNDEGDAIFTPITRILEKFKIDWIK